MRLVVEVGTVNGTVLRWSKCAENFVAEGGPLRTCLLGFRWRILAGWMVRLIQIGLNMHLIGIYKILWRLFETML
jgi:hypothetical protein